MERDIPFNLQGFSNLDDNKSIIDLIKVNQIDVKNKLLNEWLEIDIWVSESENRDLSMEKLYSVIIEGQRVKLLIDRYNNCTAIFYNGRMRNELLFKLHKLCNRYLGDQEYYVGRIGTSMFIDYFKQNYKNISKRKVLEMCRYDDEYCEGCDDDKQIHGFREWLSGTSYSSTPAIEEYNKNWDLREFHYKDAVTFMKIAREMG